MGNVREFVIAINPDEKEASNLVKTVSEYYPDHRKIFRNVIAIYVDSDTSFNDFTKTFKDLTGSHEYAIFETLNRYGEGEF